MTGTTVQLPRALETLVDSRLDTIDRMLVGRVPRQDRLAIVREVESQIYDLLQQEELQEHSRESVLAVLARLDPPEAYLPDESAGETVGAGLSASPRPRVTRQPEPRNLHTGVASGVLGLVAVFLVLLSPLPYILGVVAQSEIVMLFGWGAEILAVLAVGIPGIVLGINARFKGPWAIVGLGASTLSLLTALIASAIMFALILQAL
ncbi:MAG: hypothetical protein ACLQIB_32815 [Isosphaeraceae bacterium]